WVGERAQPMKTRLAWPTCALLIIACDHGSPGPGAPGEATDSATTDGGGPTSTASTQGDGTTSDGDDDPDGTQGPATSSTGDDGPAPSCEPLGELDPRRVLIETRTEVLASVTLSDVLTAIAVNAGLHPAPGDTHDRLFDTYRLAAQA